MIEETLRKLVAKLNDCDANDLPLEAEYNPLNPEDTRALTTILSAFLFSNCSWKDLPSIEDVLGHIVEEDSYFASYIDSMVFMARHAVAGAAAQWVRNKYGNEIANELEGFLESDDEAYVLYKERRSTPFEELYGSEAA